MKLFIFLCFSQVLICTFVCGHHGGPHDDDHDHDGQHHNNEPEALHQVATEIFKFSFKLYYQLVDAHPDDNLLLSTLSIAKALALLSLGAKSKTLSQIHEGIGFNKSSVSEETIHKGFQKLLNIIKQPKSGLELDSTIALFIDSKLDLLNKFLDDAQKFYQSEAISTDFHKVQEALEQINSYVEKKTNGKIKDVLDNLDPMTVMMITSTIFFKGSWEHAFNVDHTREEDFHVDENTVVKVPMMSRQGEYLTGYIPEIGCTVVDVPYKGNTTAVFVLPDIGKFHEVEKALENLSEEAWIKAMKSREIILSIPKFSMSGEFDLKNVLEQLGMTEVFSDHADLSGITGDSSLKLSKAVHKAMLQVDEEGTEAAAATAIGITKLSHPPRIKFNRPFFFSIYNKDISNDILSGRMMNPTK
ncbi:alpha-1-antitrypsin-like [Ranitomeya variabilis]|uniref:alpha-1-antitrypsin-like n=1 Tax=Ranitomeya variabilis TaxID=490064 RepID=UPI0040561798